MKKSNIILLFLLALAWAGCHKDKEMNAKDPVVLNVEVSVSETQARFSWQVDFAGEFHTSVEVSQDENMSDLKRVEATKEEDGFMVVVDTLTEGMKYYYCIVVWNKFSDFGQQVGNFTTLEVPQDTTYYTITVSCLPEKGGSASGGGTFVEGDTCTVMATANSGYSFVNWTENDTQVSTDSVYAFAVTGDRVLVANFTSQEYTITAIADPEEGGTVVGSGGYNHGDECTLTAMANEGYDFVNWTKNGTIVSTDSVFVFTVTETAAYMAHFEVQYYTVTVAADPEVGGIVEGGGTYTYGYSCTVRATEANGYHFVNWTENGEQVSSDEEYTFIVTSDFNLVANFTSQQYTITVTANPTDGGSVTGGGTYYEGEQCTVTAISNTGFAFTVWYEIYVDPSGSGMWPVSSDANYIFTVNSDRTLRADFTYNGGGTVPQGAINGKFTINSSGDKVYFSQGNLQYIGSASTPYWKFADNQWDYLGNNGQGSASQTADRDLFGWGTSGWDSSGATYYRPWDIDNSSGGLYGPLGQYDLTGTYANADWGVYNAISNGGNQTNQWRTLTKDEWVYVFNSRSTASGIRYAKAKVNNLNGVILLPDNWSASYYTLSNTNTSTASFSSNTITASQWSTLEQHGAVFLPAAGNRNGTSVYNVRSYGYYWSASYDNSYDAYLVGFYGSYLNPQRGYNRYNGFSVRLVHVAQ